jgi:hypothetical protein
MLLAPLQPVLRFLERHHTTLETVDFVSERLNFPEYQLTPYDYLEFAQSELDRDTTAARINCVSHIKRAVECELDTLLHLLGAGSPKRNFPSKMEFVRGAFLISNRSLDALNRLRNKVEHEYDDPDTSDLSLYFDLAEAFVLAIEGYIYMLKDSPGIVLGNHDYDVPHIGVKPEPMLRIDTETSPPAVVFEIRENGSSTNIRIEHSRFDEYTQAIGVLILLIRSTALISLDQVISRLGGKVNPPVGGAAGA